MELQDTRGELQSNLKMSAISMFATLKRLLSSLLKGFKRVTKRNPVALENREAWAKFESILAIRCNVSFASKVIYVFVWTIIGRANFQKSQAYVDKSDAGSGHSYNEFYVENLFDIVKWMLIFMNIGRFFLLIVSYWKPSICKVYMLYQSVYMMLEWSQPRDYGEMQFQILTSENVLNFCLFTFEFWPSVFSMLLPTLM